MRNFRNISRILRTTRNMPFYAVAKGNRPGVYATWDECKAQVDGHSGAKYKKFKTSQEAEAYISSNGVILRKKPEQQFSVNNKENPKVPFVDFWPKGISEGDEDDLLLASVAAAFDPVPVSKDNKKRMASNSAQQGNREGLIDMLKKLRKDSVVFDAVGQKNYGGYDFPVDAEDFVLVYTDGACERNGWHNAVAGLGVYFDDDHPLNASKPVTGKATNNAGEIQAACEAIRIAQKCNIEKLRINTDSQFLINSATIWMKSWKRKNWNLSDGTPVKNMQDYMILDKLIIDSPMRIKWNYVKGHARIKGNERADRLAKQGALLYTRPKKR